MHLEEIIIANMDGPSKSEDGKRSLPPQVEKMLASAREMEAILTSKLTKIDAVSLEKSEMAKQEALKIKADVEEIKRLSLVQTYEGEEALKAKIMEVNQRIETTTRKAAELQNQLVELHKQMFEELQENSTDVKKKIGAMTEITEENKTRMSAAIDAMVSHAKDRYVANVAIGKRIEVLEQRMKDAKFTGNLKKEEVLKKLDEQLDLILAPSKQPSADLEESNEPGVFRAEPRKS
ncbi:hypothetical protein GE061_013823 [Apolygus lucorum]|uniref:Uncharacterized protein n=1 Tax=Apolygus lucorum TaxID=248454 RepID=A0A8S9XRL3_APOLU|nr:hypothetical protein GE061_013823 [Apolygus lucorum]